MYSFPMSMISELIFYININSSQNFEDDRKCVVILIISKQSSTLIHVQYCFIRSIFLTARKFYSSRNVCKDVFYNLPYCPDCCCILSCEWKLFFVLKSIPTAKYWSVFHLVQDTLQGPVVQSPIKLILD